MKHLMARIWRRRNRVVNRKLQLTLMFISFGYVILFCAVMAAYLFIPLMRDMDISERDSLSAFVAAIRLVYLDETFWPALLLSFLAIACHSIFISSKIAGPLSRFSRIFREIKEGIVPGPMQLRPRDYLYGEMENINQMLEGLRTRLTELQQAQANLNTSITGCKDAASHCSTDELVKKMEDLEGQGKKIEEKLGYFKVIS